MTISNAIDSAMLIFLLLTLVVGHIVRNWPEKDELQEGDLWQ